MIIRARSETWNMRIGRRINSPIWYLLVPDERPLRVRARRGPVGMLLSCVTIVGQRVTSALWVRYEHIWTHAHAAARLVYRRGTLWHSAYEVFEFNQPGHAFEIRSSRQLKARLTSNTIMPVVVIDHSKGDRKCHEILLSSVVSISINLKLISRFDEERIYLYLRS